MMSCQCCLFILDYALAGIRYCHHGLELSSYTPSTPTLTKWYIFAFLGGLGPMKMLLRLSVDHNQLLSTRGLNEMYTLLHLDCSYNHLSHVEGLENCALLNTLDLRGNSLTEVNLAQPKKQTSWKMRSWLITSSAVISRSYWIIKMFHYFDVLSVFENSLYSYSN